MQGVAAVVLAAGKGKRMGSSLPKVLHKVAGLTLIEHVLNAVEPLELERTVVVVGHEAERVRAVLQSRTVTTVLQEEQLGTGHAVMQAHPALRDSGEVLLVLLGDVPLLTTATIQRLLAYHEAQEATCTVLSTLLADPQGYGRLVRDAEDNVQAVVEHKDATPDQRAIREINSGIMVFRTAALWQHLFTLKRDNAQLEYYLTDLINIFAQRGMKVAGYRVENDVEVRGINSAEQLAELERIYLAGNPPPERD